MRRGGYGAEGRTNYDQVPYEEKRAGKAISDRRYAPAARKQNRTIFLSTPTNVGSYYTVNREQEQLSELVNTRS